MTREGRVPKASKGRKGVALPPPEPTLRHRRQQQGARVGATLPHETYIAFKAHVARQRTTGDRAIVAAIERILREASDDGDAVAIGDT